MSKYRQMFEKALLDQQSAQDPIQQQYEAEIMKSNEVANMAPTISLIDSISGTNLSSSLPKRESMKDKLGQLLQMRQAQNTQKMGGLGKLAQMEMQSEQNSADRDFKKQMQGIQLLNAKAKLAKAGNGSTRKLGAEDIKAVSNIDQILTQIPKMRAALEKGDALKPSLMGYTVGGDNDATQARRMMVEAIGRLQSGGAIGIDEAKNFENLVGTLFDDDTRRMDKLKELEGEFGRRRNYYMYGPDAQLGGGSQRAPSSAMPGNMDVDSMSEAELDAIIAMGKM
jgi:hypothetical protein